MEILTKGDNIILEQLLTWLKQVPRFADVSNVEVEQRSATAEFTDFSIC